MRPIVEICGPYTAPSATAIRTATTIAAAGAVTLNGSTVSGGVATLDSQRRVAITSVADDSSLYLIVTGTTDSNDVITETVRCGNATTVYTTLDFKTVTSIVASGPSVGTISIGTNSVAGSSWMRMDEWALPNVGVQTTVSGTINYTVQQTYDDPNSIDNPVAPVDVVWTNVGTAGSTSAINAITPAPLYVRVLVNSFSSGGKVTATASQAGVVPY